MVGIAELGSGGAEPLSGRREGGGESELKEVRSGREGSGETGSMDWIDSRVYPGGKGRSRIIGRVEDGEE